MLKHSILILAGIANIVVWVGGVVLVWKGWYYGDPEEVIIGLLLMILTK